MIQVEQAVYSAHPFIVDISKTTRWTRDFTNQMFSSQERYAEGSIYAARVGEEIPGAIVGFACVRHLKHSPATNIYFVGVAPQWRSHSIGEHLLRQVALDSPHPSVRLKVATDNPRARSFYERMGFRGEPVSDALEPEYWHMTADTVELRTRSKA